LALQSSRVTVRNCLFARNQGQRGQTFGSNPAGHGAYSDGTANGFENCTFATNQGPEGFTTTIYGEGLRVGSGAAYITNCVFWGHKDDLYGSFTGIGYCNIMDGDSNGVNGNVSANPQFAGAATNNFRPLLSSPCVNAGANLPWMAGALDLDGNPRIRSGRVDMGVYERATLSTILMIR
jgi:hypothetical protein